MENSLFATELGRVTRGQTLIQSQVFKSHTSYYFLDSFMHFKFFCALLNVARVRRCKSRGNMKVTFQHSIHRSLFLLLKN